MPRKRKIGKYNAVGERIIKLGRRQIALAKLLDVSQQSVSKKLRGDVDWRVSELVHIAAQYEVTVSDLLEGYDA